MKRRKPAAAPEQPQPELPPVRVPYIIPLYAFAFPDHGMAPDSPTVAEHEGNCPDALGARGDCNCSAPFPRVVATVRDGPEIVEAADAEWTERRHQRLLE